MFKKISICIILVLAFIVSSAAIALENDKIIKVGISTNDFSKLVYQSVEFSGNGDFEVVDISTGALLGKYIANDVIKVVEKDNKFTVLKDSKVIKSNLDGPIVVRPQKNGLVSVCNLRRAGKPVLYRGILEVTKSSTKPGYFCIVNILGLEYYLRGVVPNEMPVRFGLEALKAQSVAARNYALKPRAKFYKEFDVCDSVASQVYFGAATEKDLSNQAVRETMGVVAIGSDDNLVLALYSSTAGGYTENYENAFSDPKTRVFPAKPIPYLKAKPDNSKTPNLSTEEAARAFYTSYPETFDNNSPYFRWKRDWTFKELEDVLRKSLQEQSVAGFVSPRLTKENLSEFGSLKSIKVLNRGNSGKIMNIEIETDKSNFVVSKELTIRRTFKKAGKALPSGNFVIDIDKSLPEGTISFQGGGFGHGVGMSQYGAGKMASLGFKYDDIIQHYYTGTRLTTNPIIIYSDLYKNSAEQVFYSTARKAWLSVNNIGDVNDLKVVINGKELNVDVKSGFNKRTWLDISSYINIGQNTIVYYIPTLENKRKAMKLYVQLKEARTDD